MKEVLTVLGCSGTMALMLLTGNTTNASPVPSKSNAVQISVPTPQGNSQFTSLDPNSDTVGDLAIAKLGCDCPSCRNQVVQMVLSGTLAVPQ